MKQTILVTGFEPFGGEESNPSMLIANALDGECHEDFIIRSAILPVERFRAVETAVQLINSHRPRIVIALGVAVGRTDITPEKVAINFDDYRIADNGGNQPIGEPIVTKGPAAYFSTLPINRMCQAMQDTGMPSSVSFSAGTFVCNHLMYGILNHIARNQHDIRAGFIHVPQAKEFAGNDTPSAPLEQMIKAVRSAILVSRSSATDVRKISGQSH
ncbi:pyroglutamyl-peptidase I [uncultured Maritalea sp.]|uniref:pyroglutamyl-peptidase I n=1 Tax=uncultured Maritalea sp. TaxID=757249 RepID=UPI00263459C2|nr:pyroglutamyl-peptidase I [uncultured Maritalea sp.]